MSHCYASTCSQIVRCFYFLYLLFWTASVALNLEKSFWATAKSNTTEHWSCRLSLFTAFSKARHWTKIQPTVSALAESVSNVRKTWIQLKCGLTLPPHGSVDLWPPLCRQAYWPNCGIVSSSSKISGLFCIVFFMCCHCDASKPNVQSHGSFTVHAFV